MPVQYTCNRCSKPFIGHACRRRRFCSMACRHDPADVRFWNSVTKSDACWGKGGQRDKDGYVLLKVDGERMGAHRYAWTLATGDALTTNDVIGHICDVRHCVRNDDEGTYEVRGVLLPRRGHLFRGTVSDNNLDRDIKGHYSRAKLTESDVIAIRTLAEQGEPMRALAARYTVTYMTIWMITTRRAWQHI